MTFLPTSSAKLLGHAPVNVTGTVAGKEGRDEYTEEEVSGVDTSTSVQKQTDSYTFF